MKNVRDLYTHHFLLESVRASERLVYLYYGVSCCLLLTTRVGLLWLIDRPIWIDCVVFRQYFSALLFHIFVLLHIVFFFHIYLLGLMYRITDFLFIALFCVGNDLDLDLCARR